MAKMRQLLKECPTTQHYENLNRQKRYQTKMQIKEVEQERKQLLKDDLTKVHREQSLKVATKKEVQKKYPDFKENNIDFYLKVLTQYMRQSLGVVTREELNR